MNLLRAAAIKINGDAQPWKADWTIHQEGVEVKPYMSKSIPKTEGGAASSLFVVFASVVLGKQPSVKNGWLVAPELERQQCEHAIEHVAQLMTVQQRSVTKIRSLNPTVFYEATSDEEQHFLAGLEGAYSKQQGMKITAIEPFEKPPLSLVLQRKYRKDGFALLATATIQTSAAARYRELMRFFEHAFALPPAEQLVKKLSQTLSKSMGYTKAEVRKWVSFRDGINHGDLKEADRILYDSDVDFCVARMEQAAYDILINKREWRSKDSRRDELWTPAAISTGAGVADVVLAQGQHANVRLMDAYQAFGFHAPFGPDTQLPDNWWPKLKA